MAEPARLLRMSDTPRASPASWWQLALALLLGICATVAFFVVNGIVRDMGQTKRHHTQTCLAEIAKNWVVSHSDRTCPGSGQLQTKCGPGEAMTDYWGHEIAIMCSAGVGVAAASAGVDRKWDTDDDTARIYMWPDGGQIAGESERD